jgi:hypothetical protein
MIYDVLKNISHLVLISNIQNVIPFVRKYQWKLFYCNEVN